MAQFGWAIAIGLIAPFAGIAIQRLARYIRSRVEPRMLLLMPALGLVIAGLAIGFDEATGKGTEQVLFSGQNQLPSLAAQAAHWSVGTMLLLVLCKGLAYALSLSSFRGGPVFPSMFVGAAGGIAASHLPGMSLVPGLAMGIGAMATVMLTLPLTATLLATLLLAQDGLDVMPLVIVSVVVAYVVTARLTPASPESGDAAESSAREGASEWNRQPPATSPSTATSTSATASTSP